MRYKTDSNTATTLLLSLILLKEPTFHYYNDYNENINIICRPSGVVRQALQPDREPLPHVWLWLLSIVPSTLIC